MSRPAVVVLAYKRPRALQRLFDSLLAAEYASGELVPLVISLDRSIDAAGAETMAVTRDFAWPFGPKTVIEREEHLGVVRHFRAAGDLTAEYGAIVLLEDDLTVAPPYYEFASRVLDAYGDEERIAGCCLYALWFNGFTHETFIPVDDGSDVFFLGVPHTQGLCFSARQWAGFIEWQGAVDREQQPGLHPSFGQFGPDEWFPSLASYMAETGRLFCFPRASLTVGWGDAGAHFRSGTSWFQTSPLLAGSDFRLPPLEGSLAVYDGFFELMPDRLMRLAPALAGDQFDVDLNATKRRIDLTTDLVLTTRPVRRARRSFGLEAYPPELNVAWGIAGDSIALAHRDDVRWDEWAATGAARRMHAYHARRHPASRRRSLRFALAQLIDALRRQRS